MRTILLSTFLLLSSLINAQQPNIVFILADDLGYGDLSCYGATDIRTPVIDELCNEGVKFTRAYANSTVCSPSRASILTGNYPDRVGVPGVIRNMPDNTWGNLADGISTLPEELQKAGYHTALIGKWHLGYKSPDLPNDRGFDFFKGFLGDMMDDYYSHLRDGVNWMRENSTEINPTGHATDLFSDWSVQYIKERSKENKPFFLFLTYNAPHDPVQPPMEWLKNIQDREPETTLKRQKLIAFIEHLDAGIGKVINSLESENISDNTIIIFTSDNGGALNYGASNAPFRGGKGDMFEGGIRVPCIVKWSECINPHSTDQPIMLMDFYPTLIEASGGKVNNNIPSQSLLSALKNGKFLNDRRTMVWVRREGHKFGGRDYYAISDGDNKLLQNTPFEPYSFFDMKDNCFEKVPSSVSKQSNRLQKELTKHIQKSGNIPWQ